MNKIIVILFTFSLIACGGEEKKPDTVTEKTSEKKDRVKKNMPESIDLSATDYLEGTWIDASGVMPGFHEKWIKINDTLTQVVGYFVEGKDTSIMEAIKVKMMHGNLHYIPKIENQNNGAEIPYELGTGSTKDSLIFFNNNHDFPQIINYVRKEPFVFVYLSGVEEKKPVNYTLKLKKLEEK